MPGTELQLAPAQPGEPLQKQLAPFATFEQQARKLVADAEAIALLEPSAANSKVARTMRLEVKPFRVSIEKRHAELKRPVIDEGNRLDEAKNALLEILKPLEAKLLAIEQHAEREAARIEDEKRASRAAELTPFLSGPCAVDLGKLSDADYSGLLGDAKGAYEARIAAEKKAEADRIARKNAEAEERARVLAENERLKAEADEREAAAKKEREEAAAKLAAEQERAATERAAIEDKARQEAIAAQKAREDERAKFEAECKKQREEAAERERVAAEAARKEREAVEAKAKLEREAAEKENARLAAIAEKQRQEAAAAAAALAEKVAAEKKAAAVQAAEAKRAAAAPDAAKLSALARALRAVALPSMATAEGETAVTETDAKIVALCVWIEERAQDLTEKI